MVNQKIMSAGPSASGSGTKEHLPLSMFCLKLKYLFIVWVKDTWSIELYLKQICYHISVISKATK